MLSLLWSAPCPSSQVIASASRPRSAAHVLSATTATPSSICTTSRTPGTALARASSKLATRPPNTGQRATVAYSMPGSRTSLP